MIGAASRSFGVGWPVVVFFSLAALAIALLVLAPIPDTMTAVRLVVLAAAILAAWILRRESPVLLVSPPFLLGLMSLVLFSLSPWIALMAIDDPASMPGTTSMIFQIAADPYVGKPAERLVLLFSVLSLAFSLGLCGILPRLSLRPILPGRGAAIAVFSAIIVLALTFVGLLQVLSPAVWSHKQILDAFPPLIVALAALGFLDSLARNEARAAAVTVFICAVFLFLFPFTRAFKTGAFTVAVMVVLLAATTRSLGRAIAIMAAFIALIFLVAGNFYALRNFKAPTDPFVTQLVDKLAYRQIETGYCLDRAIELAATDTSLGKSPFYFLGGMIPRIVWPDKPSLSEVSSFAKTSCLGYTLDPRNTTSFSVTLLGEPLIFAGTRGLIAALIFFAVAHGLIALGAARAGPAGTMALVGLAPWLMDFDQHFALYWANALKMFLYMSPVVAAVAWLTRRPPSATPSSSSSPAAQGDP